MDRILTCFLLELTEQQSGLASLFLLVPGGAYILGLTASAPIVGCNVIGPVVRCAAVVYVV